MKKLFYRTISAKTLVFTFFAFTAVCALVFGGGAIAQKTSAGASGSELPVIVIDAGHGGEDGGTSSSSGILEKDINLAISMKLKSLLDSMGFRTVCIRESDRLIYDSSCKTMREKKVSDIHNRFAIMQKYPDAVFISVHQNKFSDPAQHGTQVFYSGNNEKSKLLAEAIQTSVTTVLQPNNSRIVKKSGSGIYLLYHAELPAVLVECGFVSNSNDVKNLNDENYRMKLAMLIADGLLKYLMNG